MTVTNDVLPRETWGREFVLVAMGYKDQETGNDLRPEVFARLKEVCVGEFNIRTAAALPTTVTPRRCNYRLTGIP